MNKNAFGSSLLCVDKWRISDRITGLRGCLRLGETIRLINLLTPNKKPVFIAFSAVRNPYKGPETASDKLDSNPVHPVILSKNSPLYSLLPIQSDEEP